MMTQVLPPHLVPQITATQTDASISGMPSLEDVGSNQSSVKSSTTHASSVQPATGPPVSTVRHNDGTNRDDETVLTSSSLGSALSEANRLIASGSVSAADVFQFLREERERDRAHHLQVVSINRPQPEVIPEEPSTSSSNPVPSSHSSHPSPDGDDEPSFDSDSFNTPNENPEDDDSHPDTNSDHYQKLRMKTTFPAFPKTIGGDSFDEWIDAVDTALAQTAWLHEGVPSTQLITTPRTQCGRHISETLAQLLQTSVTAGKNPVATSIVQSHYREIGHGKGIELLWKFREYAYPVGPEHYLTDYEDWFNLTHKNQEDLTRFYGRVLRLSQRLNSHQIMTVSDQDVVWRYFFCVLNGPYSSVFQTLRTEFTERRFVVGGSSLFAVHQKFQTPFRVWCKKKGGGASIPNAPNQPHARRAGNSTNQDGNNPGTSNSSGGQNQPGTPDIPPWCGDVNLSAEQVTTLHKKFRCLFCRIPRVKRSERNESNSGHFTAKCEEAKRMGYTITYDGSNDQVFRHLAGGNNNSTNNSTNPQNTSNQGGNTNNNANGRRTTQSNDTTNTNESQGPP
uniref:Uncharacterized protein n=1 Tax=Entomoneis paludosa TaxID=265537 RepID=A0A7S2Y5S6_9STRA|mmetsp:Transcript_11576/g.23744  ORF Transcript_11576/g.23744 Transcript_11576/m.23744 type:complete len:565 (+) Transcript_11576:936-2630(+)